MSVASVSSAEISAARPIAARLLDPAMLGALLAAVFGLPLLALLVLAASGSGEYLAHIASTRLTEFSRSSALLAILSGAVAAIIGVSCAWIVTRFEFAGRKLFEWLLILPLAMPGYVAAYSWYALTAPGSQFEQSIGIDLPTVSGIAGAAFIFAFTLYPYVYLLARNSLEAHGRLSWDVARSLGAGPWQAFAKVGLPLIWPAVAAGTALVAMEVLADYGVADFLGVSTLTVGIVRAWSSFGDPAAAAQIAVILLFGALIFLGVERGARGRRQFVSGEAEGLQSTRTLLTGVNSLAAILVCVIPITLGLVAPAANLAWMAIETQPARSIMAAVQGTALLATASALLAIIIGLTAAFALRSGRPAATAAIRFVQAGYAVPGAVAAIAILAALVVIQAGVNWMTGGAIMAITGGSIFALLFAYQARFAAVAILPCESALGKVRRELDEAARNLGATPREVLARIHVPLAASGVATAGLLVGIEVMKELPATMILRPFDLETLAVAAHNYASDERLAQAALPALVLLAICVPATAALNLLRPNA